jgi:hypothetical protein
MMKDVKADMQGKDENALTATKKRMAKKETCEDQECREQEAEKGRGDI